MNYKLLTKWFFCWMAVFILQKMFFFIMTMKEGSGYTDMLDIVWHGLQLDIAVVGYTIIVPWLFLMVIPKFRYTFTVLRTYYYILALLTAIIIVVDASLYPFWQFKLDASVFLYTDKPGDAMASVSTWFIISRVLWMVVWFYIIWRVSVLFHLFDDNSEEVKSKWTAKRIVSQTAISLATAAIIVLAIRGGIGKGTNNVSVAYYSDNQYLNHCTVNPVFNLIYSLGKSEDFSSQFQFFDDKELTEAMQGIYHTDSVDPDTLLTTTRPDILLIVWEGCCEAMTGAEGVTPYLNNLSKEGIDFSRCTSNSYRTDRGLTCIMAGYLGLPDQSLMKMPDKGGNLPALPRALKDNGYSTTFWYGGDASFTNMAGYMYGAGFQKVVSENDFSIKERVTEWGVADETVLNRVADELIKDGTKSPRFDAIMTLSSHEPWTVSTSRLKDERQNAFNYTDECIGKMLEKLKKSKRWDNLLVIITADHGLTGISERYDPRITHIPMVWCGGAIKNARNIDKQVNQSDFAATLLGQMRISHDEFTFSRDVMSKSYSYPTATFCYNNGIQFTDSTGTTVFDNDAGKSIVGYDKTRERKAKATLQTLYRKVADL